MDDILGATILLNGMSLGDKDEHGFGQDAPALEFPTFEFLRATFGRAIITPYTECRYGFGAGVDLLGNLSRLYMPILWEVFDVYADDDWSHLRPVVEYYRHHVFGPAVWREIIRRLRAALRLYGYSRDSFAWALIAANSKHALYPGEDIDVLYLTQEQQELIFNLDYWIRHTQDINTYEISSVKYLIDSIIQVQVSMSQAAGQGRHRRAASP